MNTVKPVKLTCFSLQRHPSQKCSYVRSWLTKDLCTISASADSTGGAHCHQGLFGDWNGNLVIHWHRPRENPGSGTICSWVWRSRTEQAMANKLPCHLLWQSFKFTVKQQHPSEEPAAAQSGSIAVLCIQMQSQRV